MSLPTAPRRRTLSAIALAVLVAASSGTRKANAAPAPVATGSLGFQITADHRGEIVTTGLRPPLTVRWTAGFSAPVSYPIVVNGLVFVVGGDPSTLYAFNETSGALVWRKRAPTGFGGFVGIAYDNGLIFVVPQQTPAGTSGALFAYDAASGRVVWSAALPGQSAFSSAPTAFDGLVYTGGAGSGGTVYALQEATGHLVWTGSVENGDYSAPAVTPSGMYVSYVCPQTYRFAPATGAPIWHYSGQCEGPGGASVAVYRNQVYVRVGPGFYATDGITLSAVSGAVTGSFNSQYSPVFAGPLAFFTEPASVTAMNLDTGRVAWTVQPPAMQTFSCAPIIANDILYTTTSGGMLFGYRTTTGQRLFSASLPQPASCNESLSTPLVGLGAGDGLLVVPAGDFLVAFQ